MEIQLELTDVFELKYLKIKEIINDFLIENMNDFEESAYDCLEMCEYENDYHMTTYWIGGTYDLIKELFNANLGHRELFYQVIIDMYTNVYKGDVEALKCKIGVYDNIPHIAYECMASIILKNYQTSLLWCTIYGSQNQDMCEYNAQYNILNAIGNSEEFPVMQMSDITAAMLEVNFTVQPSSLYDVFAYTADKYSQNPISLLDNKEPIFTPDTMQYEAVVARSKWMKDIICPKGKYIDSLDHQIKLEHFDKVADVLDYDKELTRACGIANIVKDTYLNRINKPPYSFPLDERNLSIEIDEMDAKFIYNVTFKIRGICRCKNEWKNILEKGYPIPNSPAEITDLILNLTTDIKEALAGKEKVGNVLAVEGIYPRKNLSTHGLKLTNIPLSLAEHQALYIMKKAMRYLENPVISSSFGLDSTLVMHLMKRITNHSYKIVFNNSGVEYAETIDFKKLITPLWNLKDKIIETRPESTFWDYLDTYGWNFERKGSRKEVNGKKSSRSEICCNTLKHEPMKKALNEYKFDGIFSGLRADESRSRDQSGKRDGLMYATKDWGAIRLNPILFFTQDMVWEYFKKYDVPYSKIYDLVLFDDDGKIIYSPRTGCATCMVTAKYGYLKWLNHFKPKMYNLLMKKKGLGKLLYLKHLGWDLDSLKDKDSNPQISLFEEEYSSGSGDCCCHSDVDINSVIDNIDPNVLDFYIEHRTCQLEKAIS